MKLIVSILLSFSLGWIVHHYTQKEVKPLKTSSSKIECSDEELSTHETVEKIVIKEVVKYVPQTKFVYKFKEKQEAENNASTQDLFLIALEQNKFYDAMDYYQDADEEKHPFYQTALFVYFQKIEKKNQNKAIDEMQYFIEIEAQSQIIVFQLAQLFQKKKMYLKALNLLIDFSYIVSYNAQKSIHTKIKSISTSYIKELKSANNFSDLIDFLINRINAGILNDFYSFELAKVYFKIKNYIQSSQILEEVQYNKVYKERAIEMLAFIQLKLEEQEEYPIQIPLIRSGLHFLVKVYADGIPLVLLLDTGASTTSVNLNKISHFTVLKENVRFQTAGGEIYESIFKANSFNVGTEISLKNFRISGSKFPLQGEDGLLGMNFLGRFKFKIDQQEAILYLGEKY